MAKRSLIRRIGVVLVVLVLVAAAGLAFAIVVFSKPLPDGESGATADALARSVEAAVHKDAWDRTMAVTWYFGGRNRHLWDRQRMFDRVTWGDSEVLVNLSTQTGLAFVKNNGTPLVGAKAEKLVKKAYADWINDSFWLNPLAKLFDDGVVRKRIAQADGTAALLISYQSGGLTPGDSYLWRLGADGRPVALQMWVSIIPLKGIEASFEGWTTLSTGAMVSTLHKMPAFTLPVTEVAGAATLAELVPGPDPFAALVQAH